MERARPRSGPLSLGSLRRVAGSCPRPVGAGAVPPDGRVLGAVRFDGVVGWMSVPGAWGVSPVVYPRVVCRVQIDRRGGRFAILWLFAGFSRLFGADCLSRPLRLFSGTIGGRLSAVPRGGPPGGCVGGYNKQKPRRTCVQRGFQCPGQESIRANGCEWLNFRLFYNYLFYSILKFIRMDIGLFYFSRFS